MRRPARNCRSKRANSETGWSPITYLRKIFFPCLSSMDALQTNKQKKKKTHNYVGSLLDCVKKLSVGVLDIRNVKSVP